MVFTDATLHTWKTLQTMAKNRPRVPLKMHTEKFYGMHKFNILVAESKEFGVEYISVVEGSISLKGVVTMLATIK